MSPRPFRVSRGVPPALAAVSLAVLSAVPGGLASRPPGFDAAPSAAVTDIREATLSIPAIGLSGLPVVPYQGSPDDAAGTRIQDRGVAASPYGPGGGVGPGDVGNYIVTGHRSVAGGPMGALPSLSEGASVFVTASGVTYRYVITSTRTTSFRSPSSMEEQRAPVPGSSGTSPSGAMITVSTCLTPEDDAAGNHWRDAQNNPEHRVDKIGVLAETGS